MTQSKRTLPPEPPTVAGGVNLDDLRDIFERPFDGEDDPRIRVAQCITRTEADAVLEFNGDIRAALASRPVASVEEVARIIINRVWQNTNGMLVGVDLAVADILALTANPSAKPSTDSQGDG